MQEKIQFHDIAKTDFPPTPFNCWLGDERVTVLNVERFSKYSGVLTVQRAAMPAPETISRIAYAWAAAWAAAVAWMISGSV